MKNLIPIFILLFALNSCREKPPRENTATSSQKDTIATPAQEQQQEQVPSYPKTGKKAPDFVPSSYEIQYQATGDLNGDQLPDIALVLKRKSSKTSPRPALVLLQNEDHSYRLDKVSELAMPIEYNEFDFKLYDTETLSIENGSLSIKLYGKDNAFGTFAYSGTDLVLTNVEAYYRGAGEQEGIAANLATGEQTTTRTEFISGEDEPKITETKQKIKKEHYFFESVSIVDFFQ